MKTYNVGIIGPGFIGGVHAYAYENLKYYYPDADFRTKIYGVCSGREETLKRIKKDTCYNLYTTDFRELIKDKAIDIIDICSPNKLHREQILCSIKEKKHIYCEKPLVTNVHEATEIIDNVKGFDRAHQVAFNNRFFPASVKAHSLIKEGAIGNPISFRIAYYHSGSLDKNKPIGWKQEEGAGVKLDLGSHAVDLINFFLGKFSEVSASSRILYPERKRGDGETVKINVEDYFYCGAKLENGAIGAIEASKIAAGTQDELKYEIYGDGGALRYNSMEPNFLEFFSQKEQEKGYMKIPTVSRYEESSFPGPKFSVGWIRSHVHSIYKFVSAIHNGYEAVPSFLDGYYNMRILDAASLSEKENRWVGV